VTPTPQTPTPEQRAEWQRLADAATPGPWEFCPGGDNTGSDADLKLGSIRGSVPGGGCYHLARVWNDGPNPEADARLIAAAREAVPALLSALSAAEERARTAEDCGDPDETLACDCRRHLSQRLQPTIRRALAAEERARAAESRVASLEEELREACAVLNEIARGKHQYDRMFGVVQIETRGEVHTLKERAAKCAKAARAALSAPSPRPSPGGDARSLPDGTLVTCEHCEYPHLKGDDGVRCLFPKVAPERSETPAPDHKENDHE
jgi:hypothetical protein